MTDRRMFMAGLAAGAMGGLLVGRLKAQQGQPRRMPYLNAGQQVLAETRGPVQAAIPAAGGGRTRTTRTRRELFAALLGGLAVSPGAACDTPGGGMVQIDGYEALPRGELPVRRPASRQRLLRALRGIGQPANEGMTRTRMWAQFSLTNKVIAGGVDVFWHAHPMTGGRRGHPGIARNIAS